jgi:O-acetyl-ADP-ribose deacetylase
MTHLEYALGDITRQPDIEAIVNSANAHLIAGSGVCGAIHRAAGPQLSEYCKPFAPLAVGMAILTPGFALPNRYVIHVKGPHYLLDHAPETGLAIAVRRCIQIAEENQIASIAFPAISTGVYKFPLPHAAEIMITTAMDALHGLLHLKRIRWILTTPAALQIFQSGR